MNAGRTIQLAARLRGLSPNDRVWLLSRLSADEKRRVGALLEAACGSSEPARDEHAECDAEAAPPAPPASPLERLEQADPVRLAAVLANEPAAVREALDALRAGGAGAGRLAPAVRIALVECAAEAAERTEPTELAPVEATPAVQAARRARPRRRRRWAS